jgi:hypothetical protein
MLSPYQVLFPNRHRAKIIRKKTLCPKANSTVKKDSELLLQIEQLRRISHAVTQSYSRPRLPSAKADGKEGSIGLKPPQEWRIEN